MLHSLPSTPSSYFNVHGLWAGTEDFDLLFSVSIYISPKHNSTPRSHPVVLGSRRPFGELISNV